MTLGDLLLHEQSSQLPTISGLVHNLRLFNGESSNTQTNDADLLAELGEHITHLPSLSDEDVALAETLIALLARFDRLSTIDSTISEHDQPSNVSWSPIEPPPAGDLFAALRRQVSELQTERLYAPESAPNVPPVLAVESALIWSEIDGALEKLLSLCRQRTDAASFTLPPEYDELPPQYDERFSMDKKSIISSTSATGELSEKMRHDLDAVTAAIDRLYAVCPQLHDQRVELKDPKIRQMEKARAAGRTDADDAKDLERILTMISKASDRKMVNQSVVLEGGMAERLERAREREAARVS
jgi:ubiquitin-protein ligase E3 D